MPCGRGYNWNPIPTFTLIFVVINERRFLSPLFFNAFNSKLSKQQFQQVECFTESNFMYIRYKVGLLLNVYRNGCLGDSQDMMFGLGIVTTPYDGRAH
ncbi:hypothetical protein TNCT_86231 [Trichonephila clavata]|uniref:Uncharacterized protein n=1 Tax=Trichonephila clavata TaxID=2740835 RepID=A0A8X6F5K5_TRICU|nr:hypothetical protein TNCT_86231 [Trichonephila clavata]